MVLAPRALWGVADQIGPPLRRDDDGRSRPGAGGLSWLVLELEGIQLADL